MRFLTTLSYSRENPVTATLQLLHRLQLPVTATTAAQTLQEHPDYPSFLSISDALNQWKIDNICLRPGPEQLLQLPVPFIAHVKTEGGLFVTVLDVTTTQLLCSDPKNINKTFTIEMEQFLSTWSGTALAVEPSEQAGEKNYAARRRLEKKTQARLPLIIATFLAIAAYYAAINLFPLTALTTLATFTVLIKLLGCVTTGLLLWYEIDQNNPVLKQICSAGKTTDCDAVLKSGAAKIFKQLSWSEVGFFYFAGGFLFLLTNSVSAPVLWIMAAINLMAVPYTVFSVFYQWRVLRQWCPLCLVVQALLLTEFILFFFLFRNGPGAYLLFNIGVAAQTAGYIFSFIIAFALPAIGWFYTRPLLYKVQNTEKTSVELARLKHNKAIFDGLLKKEKAIPASPREMGIVLGNPNASNTLIKVCNPYCGPCAKAHPAIETLLKENDDLKVQIIFATTEDTNDMIARPVKHLLAIATQKDKNLIHQALDDWYIPDNKNYEIFASKYPVDNEELEACNNKIKAMSLWCRETEIAFTPTIFVNGHQLPQLYNVTDLKYILSE